MFSSAILFSSKLCNPAFRANQNQLQCPDLRPWRGLNQDEEDDLLSLLPSHYPLRCGGASLPWPHCCTWKIRYNQGLIRFGLWIWVTWLQVEYPTIWGLNPTMKILNFFFSLISLYNNRNQWQLQRSIFKRITLFIELQVQHIIYFQTQQCSFIIVNVFLLFVQNMGTSPQSLALRISISIASADPSSKKQLNHFLSLSANPSVHCQANYRGGA